MEPARAGPEARASGGRGRAEPLIIAVANSLRTVLSAAHSAPEQRGVAMGVVTSYWSLALFIMPALLGGIATVVGLRATVAAAGAAVLLVGVAGPLLFRLLLPPPQAARTPEGPRLAVRAPC